METQLTYLNDNQLFSAIDLHFANYIQEISDTQESEIHLAAALVSWSTRNGNVCLDINKVVNKSFFDNAGIDRSIVIPKLNVWTDKIANCNAVGKPGDSKPLILDSKNRLYFYRYWEYEKMIADTIKERLQSKIENIDYQKLKQSVNRIFSNHRPNELDMQKVASIVAVLNRFCVISGGPGSGKTTTVAKLLALLIELSGDNGIHIVLCAPTGKAAASLSNTIRSIKSDLRCHDTVKMAIPEEAFTIHRLLISITGSPYFRHNKDNPLKADVILVDEASMVDVALMAKLFNSIQKFTRIILVGDKDQLSSVEAGSALGDICNRETVTRVSKDTLDAIDQFLKDKETHFPHVLERQKGLREHIIVLDKNYRFDEYSGIGGFSRAVNDGDCEAALSHLIDSNDKGIDLKEVNDRKTLYEALKEKIVDMYTPYLTADDPYKAVKLFNQFKVLCALRSGIFGVDSINQFIQKILYENGLIQFDEQEPDSMYKGRPIIITHNDYSLGLFNGDIGIILPEFGSKTGDLRAIFPINRSEIKHVPLHRLPGHETVYAMTIHKSQGSEFNDVIIILPDNYYPILTRELVYTGITRAIRSVSIWGKKEVLKEAISKKIERTSGLRDALWGD